MLARALALLSSVAAAGASGHCVEELHLFTSAGGDRAWTVRVSCAAQRMDFTLQQQARALNATACTASLCSGRCVDGATGPHGATLACSLPHLAPERLGAAADALLVAAGHDTGLVAARARKHCDAAASASDVQLSCYSPWERLRADTISAALAAAPCAGADGLLGGVDAVAVLGCKARALRVDARASSGSSELALTCVAADATAAAAGLARALVRAPWCPAIRARELRASGESATFSQRDASEWIGRSGAALAEWSGGDEGSAPARQPQPALRVSLPVSGFDAAMTVAVAAPARPLAATILVRIPPWLELLAPPPAHCQAVAQGSPLAWGSRLRCSLQLAALQAHVLSLPARLVPLPSSQFPADKARGLEAPAVSMEYHLEDVSPADDGTSALHTVHSDRALPRKGRARSASGTHACPARPPALVVPVPYPDQSMPFNVITLSGTAFCFLLGTLWTLMLRDKLPGDDAGAGRAGPLQKLRAALLRCVRRR